MFVVLNQNASLKLLSDECELGDVVDGKTVINVDGEVALTCRDRSSKACADCCLGPENEAFGDSICNYPMNGSARERI